MGETIDCDFVHQINASQQCDFVRNNSDCQEASGILNYVTLLFCDFQDNKPVGLTIFAFWLIFLFVGLAEAADNFFCPNLGTISKTLRLSHNIAGITILALGNGAPDIFSSFASVSQSRPELLLGELFGAGVFVSTVVAGSICLARPFKLMERPFLRDVVFYLFAGFWAFFIFYRQEIRLLDSIGFLVLYLVYLIVVVVGRYVHQKIRRRRLTEALLNQIQEDDEEDTIPTFNVFTPNQNQIIVAVLPETDETAEDVDDVTPEASVMANGDATRPRDVDETLDNVTSNVTDEVFTPCSPGWLQLWRALIPSQLFSRRTKLYWRIWELIKLPYYIAFSLTIPIASTDLIEANGDESESTSEADSSINDWSQYLHLIQCILAPQVITFFIGFGFRDIVIDPSDRFHIWELVLVAGLVAAIFLLCTTSPLRPPTWRPIFAFLGFGVAVVWIYALANEIVALLKVFGVALGFSDAILGLTLLAWGNSISDLVADVAVARRGYPRMGFSACFGGPLFNLLLGVGLPFTIQFFRDDNFSMRVEFSPMVIVLSASLAVSLLSSFLFLPMAKFHAGKCHGIFLILLYLVLLSIALTVEIYYGGIGLKQTFGLHW